MFIWCSKISLSKIYFGLESGREKESKSFYGRNRAFFPILPCHRMESNEIMTMMMKRRATTEQNIPDLDPKSDLCVDFNYDVIDVFLRWFAFLFFFRCSDTVRSLIKCLFSRRTGRFYR